MIDLPDLLFEKRKNIAILKLNRPNKLNATNANIRNGIVQVCDEIKGDDGIRVMIITGSGSAFCSGADMAELSSGAIWSPAGTEGRRNIAQPFGHHTFAIRKLQKPVIAAVNGVAAGGGLSLALACDIRIASEKAKFAAVWVKRGVTPDAGVTYFLPQVIGVSKACEILFKGSILDAEEAESLRIANIVVPHDQLIERSLEMAEQIAKNAPVAMELTKQMVYLGFDNPLEAQLHLETSAVKICFKTKDYEEGIRSFLEKREPIFTGK